MPRTKLSAKIGGTLYPVGTVLAPELVEKLLPEFYAAACAKPFSDEHDAFTMSQFWKADFVVGEARIHSLAKAGNLLVCYGGEYAGKHKGKFFVARTTGMARARHPEADPAFRICDDEHSWVLSGESFVKVPK